MSAVTVRTRLKYHNFKKATGIQELQNVTSVMR
jgi:hypothetical protein